MLPKALVWNSPERLLLVVFRNTCIAELWLVKNKLQGCDKKETRIGMNDTWVRKCAAYLFYLEGSVLLMKKRHI